MCIVPDRCNITYDRRLVPTETPEDAIAEIQAIIDRLSAEDPDFHATVQGLRRPAHDLHRHH